MSLCVLRVFVVNWSELDALGRLNLCHENSSEELGNYMVDKAKIDMSSSGRQAGVDDLTKWFPEIPAKVPPGVTLADLEAAEEMICDWRDYGGYRAFDVALKVYEHLATAVQKAKQSTR